MQFYDGKENDKELIKSYLVNNDYIKVNYLYNDSFVTYKYTKEKEEEITNLMIQQALKRDKELYDKIYKKVKLHYSEMILSLLSTICSLKGKLPLLLCLSFILGLIATTNLTENYEKLKEMKKFRLYNSMKEELSKKENKDITKIIEFDPFYREPINIGTLDNFSYSNVKTIKKELKRRNNMLDNAKGV